MGNIPTHSDNQSNQESDSHVPIIDRSEESEQIFEEDDTLNSLIESKEDHSIDNDHNEPFNDNVFHLVSSAFFSTTSSFEVTTSLFSAFSKTKTSRPRRLPFRFLFLSKASHD